VHTVETPQLRVLRRLTILVNTWRIEPSKIQTFKVMRLSRRTRGQAMLDPASLIAHQSLRGIRELARVTPRCQRHIPKPPILPVLQDRVGNTMAAHLILEHLGDQIKTTMEVDMGLQTLATTHARYRYCNGGFEKEGQGCFFAEFFIRLF
jgi:hypothetical protein